MTARREAGVGETGSGELCRCAGSEAGVVFRLNRRHATDHRGLKLVRLELPPEVQKQFRVEAAKEGMSMAAMARRVVEEWIAKRQKGAK